MRQCMLCLLVVLLLGGCGTNRSRDMLPGWTDASTGFAQPHPSALMSTTIEGRRTQALRLTIDAAPERSRTRLSRPLDAPPPGMYRLSAWFRASHRTEVEVVTRLLRPPQTIYGAQRQTLAANQWTKVQTLFDMPALQDQVELVLLGSDAGTLWIAEPVFERVDPATLTAQERELYQQVRGPEIPPIDEARLLADIDARILAHRTAPLVIRVVDSQGHPLPNQDVQVRHVRHGFAFGAGFDNRLLPADQQTPSRQAATQPATPPSEEELRIDQLHREAFVRLFNLATVHMYWGSYETEPGVFRDQDRLRIVRWLHDHGLAARGHPVFWNTSLPRAWRAGVVPAADMRAKMDALLLHGSSQLYSQFRDADVFNELVNWERFRNPMTDLFKEQGKLALAAHYLREFKRLNPGVGAVVNDYETSPRYYQLIKQLLEAGSPIDMIGQQSHMHTGTWSPTMVWTVLERLSQLRRPVLFTELSVLSGPPRPFNWKDRVPGWVTDPEHERLQADYLEQLYRLIYSHPNAAGIILWNYTDRRSWLGCPVGILRADGSPKPAYARLDHLINHAWRTHGRLVTDARGMASIDVAFEGRYRIESRGAVVEGDHSRQSPLTITVTAVGP